MRAGAGCSVVSSDEDLAELCKLGIFLKQKGHTRQKPDKQFAWADEGVFLYEVVENCLWCGCTN